LEIVDLFYGLGDHRRFGRIGHKERGPAVPQYIFELPRFNQAVYYDEYASAKRSEERRVGKE
jgi:hypothetical protein